MSLVLAITLFVASLAAESRSTPTPIPPRGEVRAAAVAALEPELALDFASRRIPGAALVIIEDGRVALARGFGTTQAQGGVPAGPATLFRLGSTTKTIVAAAALVMVDQGRLELHQPISRYLPELPPRLGRLALHQLLTHTAGLFDDAPMHGPGDDGALARTVAGWSDDAVFLEPGRWFSYSNPGYWLIGRILERVDGRPFADAVKGLVLDPVGMAHSTFRPEAAGREPLAIPHSGKGAPIRRSPNHAGTWPSGSLYSSADDMSRFLLALLGDGMLEGRRVLPRSVVRELLVSRVNIEEPRDHRYGYGLTFQVVAGETLAFHAGTRAGYGSYFTLVPSRRFAAMTLTNRSATMLSDWHRVAIRRLLALDAVDVERKPLAGQRTTLSESEFRSLLGRYENPPGIRFELYNSKFIPWIPEGGQLFSKRGWMRMPVYAVGPDRFANDQMTFRLTRGSDGTPRFLHGEYRTLVRREPRDGRR